MKKFIFVTGPSESGKSGGLNYLSDKYKNEIKHLKIRDIFPEVYKDSKSNKKFQDWYNYEFKNNFESLWDRYISKADEMSGNARIIIMDTMYGIKSIEYLYSKLGEKLVVLYIDADFNMRVKREYNRLRTCSITSNGKDDLKITINSVTKKTIEKDRLKKKRETFEYKDLVYHGKKICVGNRNKEKPFTYIIENNGTLEDFHNKLEIFISNELID